MYRIYCKEPELHKTLIRCFSCFYRLLVKDDELEIHLFLTSLETDKRKGLKGVKTIKNRKEK